MDRVNWMLILTGEVILALETEWLKTFQDRFVVLHLRLGPWAFASLLLSSHSASSLRLWFSLLFCVATLNSHSRDLVVPRGADSSSADGGTCTGALSRDLDLCRLPENQSLHQVLKTALGYSLAVLLVPVAFVTLESVAFEALVRKDVHDHAIWTVVVVIIIIIMVIIIIIIIVTHWNWFQLRLRRLS